MKTYLFILVLTFTFLSCKNQTVETDLKTQVDQIILPYIYSGSRPGIAVGIYDEGNTDMYFYGYADLESKNRIDEYTMFEIGSITKTFTSVMLAYLEAEALLNRDMLLQEFLPEAINAPNYSGEEITLLQLANHSSALPYMPSNFNLRQIPPPFDTYSTNDMYRFLDSYQLGRSPGEAYEYSNIGPGLLGLITSEAYGKTYREMISEVILNPLQMHSTVFEFESTEHPVSTGYVGRKTMDQWIFTESFEASGALKSNLHDMMLYLEANMTNLDDALYSAIRETHQETFTGEERLGMAWFINDIDGRDVIWHNGGTGGYSTITAFNKELQKGVVILTNGQSGQENEIFMGLEVMKLILND
jgi:D-alanyl-D-alanine-carboxypeptidase/D-alanyl-D-alanine-endopeptidase